MFDNPTPAQLRVAAERLGMRPSDDYLEAVARITVPLANAYAALDALPDELPEVRYPRTGGRRPSPDENPYGAWYMRTSIKGAPEGKLAGRQVAVKDTMCVAGVPMMNGASVLEGYVPEIDATVVTRILDAGGEIVGKTVCEYFSVSGGSHTSATGQVQNPRKPGYSAGGSSSGAAAVVAAGDVALSLGGDQAGSVRIPSCYCGIYGLKPTYGLVPYTGIMPLEPTTDHCGPMTATVRDNALLLEVIAGPDGIDSRQRGVKVANYTAALDQGIEGLRIGVLREGFGRHNSEPDVDAKVRAAAQQLAKLGAVVEDISIPMHNYGFPIWAAIAHDGGFYTMLETNALGTGAEGLYLSSLGKAVSGWRYSGDDFADTIKIMALFGRYSLDRYRGLYYAKAQNLRRRLRAAYDAALASYDLLLLPTLPIKATKLPAPDAGPEEVTARGWEMIENTCPFNVSGHPAMNIPCAMQDGRPIGMMLVGRHWDEPTIYRAAAAFETSVDWTAQ
ncbi:MAG TPA: amidase [Burkholderiales bacterium]